VINGQCGTILWSTRKIEVDRFGFMFFAFVNMLFFASRLLLTSRCKLVEVFMTGAMYRSQQHGRRGQQINTKHPGRQSQNLRSSLADGDIKLVIFVFLAREYDGLNSTLFLSL